MPIGALVEIEAPVSNIVGMFKRIDATRLGIMQEGGIEEETEFTKKLLLPEKDFITEEIEKEDRRRKMKLRMLRKKAGL